RDGAWSAFWTVGIKDGATIWPPEIDFFESFNAAFGEAYTQYSTSSALHVGPHGGNQRVLVTGFQSELNKVGFAEDVNLNTQIHTYACLIEDDYITHFVDGIETVQHRNMLDAEDGSEDWAFYPIVNVAVKTGADNPYDEGTG